MALDLQDAITQGFIDSGFNAVSHYGWGLQPEELEEFIDDQDYAYIMHYTQLLPNEGLMLDSGAFVKRGQLVMYTIGKKPKATVLKHHEFLNVLLNTECDELGVTPDAPFDFPSASPTVRFWEYRPVGEIATSADRFGGYWIVSQPILYEAKII